MIGFQGRAAGRLATETRESHGKARVYLLCKDAWLKPLLVADRARHFFKELLARRLFKVTPIGYHIVLSFFFCPRFAARAGTFSVFNA